MSGQNSFDAKSFAVWCGARWRFCTLAIGLALAITLTVSLLQTKQYTSTAAILIGAPANNDPRAFTAMNPTYLDSLRVWERVTSSDSLFLQALEKVPVPGPAGSVKQRILRVTKPAGMALLEISITLPDPRKAQALAQTLAELTVAQSHSADDQVGTEIGVDYREQKELAEARVAKAVQGREALAKSAPVEALQSELTAASELRARLDTEIALVRADAESARATQNESGLLSAAARLNSLERQGASAASAVSSVAARLETAKNQRNMADAELQSARTALDTLDGFLIQTGAESKFRGERLRLVDTGVVPKQPSSPNMLINLIAALTASGLGCLIYLALAFGLRRDSHDRAERLYSLR
jgi:uncharacterized protein involved in exopolysaccharide biosynthesis